MSKLYLTGARLVLADTVVEGGALLIEDGQIAAIEPDGVSGAPEYRLDGHTLMPGMVDLHCDALEKEVEPRPNVHFPLDYAVAQADKRNAAAGITTVFHALSFAHGELGVRNNRMAADIARHVHRYAPHGLVDNRVHCRYEVTDATGLPVLLQLLEEDAMHLASVMDHTPGQGQFKDLAAYRDYISRTYGKSGAEAEAMARQKQAAADGALERVSTLIAAATGRGVRVASHDDDSPERVHTMAELGVTLSEFPINLETARAARECGSRTIFGAPNVLRGKSQSGSMRALDAVLANVADCLCADYAPGALLPSVMALPELAGIGLPQAVRLVTANPARAAGLSDRGEIAVGLAADLIAFREVVGFPQVTHVWRQGRQVYRAGF